MFIFGKIRKYDGEGVFFLRKIHFHFLKNLLLHEKWDRGKYAVVAEHLVYPNSRESNW